MTAYGLIVVHSSRWFIVHDKSKVPRPSILSIHQTPTIMRYLKASSRIQISLLKLQAHPSLIIIHWHRMTSRIVRPVIRQVPWRITSTNARRTDSCPYWFRDSILLLYFSPSFRLSADAFFYCNTFATKLNTDLVYTLPTILYLN